MRIFLVFTLATQQVVAFAHDSNGAIAAIYKGVMCPLLLTSKKKNEIKVAMQ